MAPSLKRGELLNPNGYALYRRWQRALLGGSKPCICGRLISMAAKTCFACGPMAIGRCGRCDSAIVFSTPIARSWDCSCTKQRTEETLPDYWKLNKACTGARKAAA